MRVLGIDPGLANVGWGLVSNSKAETKSGLKRLASGHIQTGPELPLEERIFTITSDMKKVIKLGAPNMVVIERFNPHIGMKNRMKTAEIMAVYGALLFAIKESGKELYIMPPNIWMRRFLNIGKTKKFTKLHLKKKVNMILESDISVEHEAEALGLAIMGFK